MEAPTIDWTLFQQELDGIFHTRHDAYPAGSPEHSELQQFVQRLYSLQAAKRRKEQAGSGATGRQAGQGAGEGPPPSGLAQQLGLPAAYDPRYRVNVSVVADSERLRQGQQALRQRLRKLERSAAPGAALPSEQQVIEEYRQLLAWWEDFYQRRQQARLRDMARDRAALPIAAYAQDIVQAVRSNPAVVIAGDTGEGRPLRCCGCKPKGWQAPLLLLLLIPLVPPILGCVGC